MKFSVMVKTVHAEMDILLGDTVRRRDIYTPFYELSVKPLQEDVSQLSNLEYILLYSFQEFHGNVYDQVGQDACFADSRFGDLRAGSILTIAGPVYPLRLDYEGQRFAPFHYAILDPALHPPITDVNGDIDLPLTSWLVADTSLEDEGALMDQTNLVVAWNCAHY